eukprot:TRINITY_DN1923_c0_g5_i2.p1 TRINITY_DN1923_c0_g5~~TRINITY_DN1923_c0_g5_i2.p1  ORF type:complete len:400 (-),score=83.21 TRINITY_DN1923_c0_g5_i2:148-1347(-)
MSFIQMVEICFRDIIHAVMPTWTGFNDGGTSDFNKICEIYLECFKITADLNNKSILFVEFQPNSLQIPTHLNCQAIVCTLINYINLFKPEQHQLESVKFISQNEKGYQAFKYQLESRLAATLHKSLEEQLLQRDSQMFNSLSEATSLKKMRLKSNSQDDELDKKLLQSSNTKNDKEKSLGIIMEVDEGQSNSHKVQQNENDILEKVREEIQKEGNDLDLNENFKVENNNNNIISSSNDVSNNNNNNNNNNNSNIIYDNNKSNEGSKNESDDNEKAAKNNHYNINIDNSYSKNDSKQQKNNQYQMKVGDENIIEKYYNVLEDIAEMIIQDYPEMKNELESQKLKKESFQDNLNLMIKIISKNPNYQQLLKKQITNIEYKYKSILDSANLEFIFNQIKKIA